MKLLFLAEKQSWYIRYRVGPTETLLRVPSPICSDRVGQWCFARKTLGRIARMIWKKVVWTGTAAASPSLKTLLHKPHPNAAASYPLGGEFKMYHFSLKFCLGLDLSLGTLRQPLMWVSESPRDVSQVVPMPASMIFLLALLKPP